MLAVAIMRDSMKRFVVILGFAVAGCDMVPPQWAAYPPTRVEVQGSTFDVRRNGVKAFAFRRNSEWAPNFRSVALKGAAAIEQATGCDLHDGSLTGDAVMMTGLVRCGDGADLERYLAEQRIITGVAAILQGQ